MGHQRPGPGGGHGDERLEDLLDGRQGLHSQPCRYDR